MKALELIEIFSEDSYRSDYTNAKAKGTCILCGRLAKEFRNPSARLEYHVSALYQDCQDNLNCCMKARPQIPNHSIAR